MVSAFTVVLSLATAGSAAAATKNGIKPLAPNAGTSVPVGKSPTFRMKVKGPGQVWVHVCRSRNKDGEGFWLNRPGRYYWQAFRIACNSHDCEQEGPTVRFRVSAAEAPGPAPAPVPEPTPVPEPATGSCDPNYSGCLDPNAYDYDCLGGSGDGPLYTGAVQVYGVDHFDLDRDGDGIGCDDS